ncbi:hypothetical protein Tco_0711134 [Tanacetum coccineum]
MNFRSALNILRLTISPEVCFLHALRSLDFEPLLLSLSSMPSCDLVSLTNILILLHYLESLLTISLDRLEIFEGRSVVLSELCGVLSLILELS